MTKIIVEETVNASVSEVWKSWDDFGGIARFAPNLKNSYLLDGSTKTGLGAKRHCDMADGKNFLKEEIIEYIPNEKLVIDIIDGSMPMKSGTATFDLKSLGKNRTKVTMTMDFVPKFGVAGKVMMGAMKPVFRKLLQSMLKGNADYVQYGKIANHQSA
ncbi:MAG: SRPBCC family protein [Rhizobiaceae bacterium]